MSDRAARVDVLVIGAGPAGAATAIGAVRRGMRVVLVDRASFPRDKVCGAFVAPEGRAALERLGALDAIVRHGPDRIDRFALHSRGGTRVEGPLPGVSSPADRALGISRSALDATLVEVARELGVEVRERVDAHAAIRTASGRVGGARLRPVGSRRGASGSDASLEADAVVLAGGARTSFKRDVFGPSRAHATARTPYGLRAVLDETAERLRGAVELFAFRGGYAGLSLLEDDRVNLALLVERDALREAGGSVDHLARAELSRVPRLGEILESGALGQRAATGPLFFGAERTGAPGLLCVGDAAGTVDPLCGEGISHALLGAELAVSTLHTALDRGGLDREACAGYDRDWRAAFGRVTRINRVAGRLLSSRVLSGPSIALLARMPPRVALGVIGTTRVGVGGGPPVASAGSGTLSR